MNEQLALSGTIDGARPLCQQCDQPFTARAGSGGKPQRFCCEECRRQFHAENPTPPTPKGVATSLAVQQPHPPAPISKPAIDNSPDWDWHRERDSIVIPGQPAVAVYFNPRGEVVIRQESQYPPDEDHFVYIQIQNLDPLIDQLQRIARREIEPG